MSFSSHNRYNREICRAYQSTVPILVANHILGLVSMELERAALHDRCRPMQTDAKDGVHTSMRWRPAKFSETMWWEIGNMDAHCEP